MLFEDSLTDWGLIILDDLSDFPVQSWARCQNETWFLKNIYLFIFPPHSPVSPHTQSVHYTPLPVYAQCSQHCCYTVDGARVPNLGVRTSQGDIKCIRGGERRLIGHSEHTCLLYTVPAWLLQHFSAAACTFLYDVRNEHGIKPPILWLLYSHKCNKAMAREKERKASCLHIIRSLFKLQNFLSPPQTCQACCCPASLPLHYPNIHLWALRDNYLSCPRFYVCHIFGKRWFQSWTLAIFCCFNESVNSNMSSLTEVRMDCDFLGRYKNYDLADSWWFILSHLYFFVVIHSAFFPMKTRKLSLQMIL